MPKPRVSSARPICRTVYWNPEVKKDPPNSSIHHDDKSTYFVLLKKEILRLEEMIRNAGGSCRQAVSKCLNFFGSSEDQGIEVLLNQMSVPLADSQSRIHGVILWELYVARIFSVVGFVHNSIMKKLQDVELESTFRLQLRCLLDMLSEIIPGTLYRDVLNYSITLRGLDEKKCENQTSAAQSHIDSRNNEATSNPMRDEIHESKICSSLESTTRNDTLPGHADANRLNTTNHLAADLYVYPFTYISCSNQNDRIQLLKVAVPEVASDALTAMVDSIHAAVEAVLENFYKDEITEQVLSASQNSTSDLSETIIRGKLLVALKKQHTSFISLHEELCYLKAKYKKLAIANHLKIKALHLQMGQNEETWREKYVQLQKFMAKTVQSLEMKILSSKDNQNTTLKSPLTLSDRIRTLTQCHRSSHDMRSEMDEKNPASTIRVTSLKEIEHLKAQVHHMESVITAFNREQSSYREKELLWSKRRVELESENMTLLEKLSASLSENAKSKRKLEALETKVIELSHEIRVSSLELSISKNTEEEVHKLLRTKDNEIQRKNSALESFERKIRAIEHDCATKSSQLLMLKNGGDAFCGKLINELEKYAKKEQEAMREIEKYKSVQQEYEALKINHEELIQSKGKMLIHAEEEERVFQNVLRLITDDFEGFSKNLSESSIQENTVEIERLEKQMEEIRGKYKHVLYLSRENMNKHDIKVPLESLDPHNIPTKTDGYSSKLVLSEFIRLRVSEIQHDFLRCKVENINTQRKVSSKDLEIKELKHELEILKKRECDERAQICSLEMKMKNFEDEYKGLKLSYDSIKNQVERMEITNKRQSSDICRKEQIIGSLSTALNMKNIS